MRWIFRPLFACLGVLIAAGGVFLFSKTVTVLSVKNLDRPGSLYFKVAPSEQVILFYTNSMYDAPVEEVFEVKDGDILLTEVRSGSPAVMEYYGFEGTGPVQALRKSVGQAFSIQASMGQDQGLKIGQRTLHLAAIAGGGDRILVRVDQVSPAKLLWWNVSGNAKVNPSTTH